MKWLITLLFFVSHQVKAEINLYSLKEVVSIIKISENQYDVLCKNHDREIVTKEDIINENVCPYKSQSPQKEKIDVLFVMDNSATMLNIQNNISMRAKEFIQKLEDANYDYKIAVTSTDAYYGDLFINNNCLLCKEEQTAFKFGSIYKNKIIDNLAENKVESLQENLIIGNKGSGDERPFSSIFAALNSKLNKGFLREKSLLYIYIITNEDDFSHSKINLNEDYKNPDLFSINKIISDLENLTQNNNMKSYWIHTISVRDNACKDSFSMGAKVGQRLTDLVNASNKGSYQSICDFNKNSQ